MTDFVWIFKCQIERFKSRETIVRCDWIEKKKIIHVNHIRTCVILFLNYFCSIDVYL